jgi:RNA polymerase sigma-70 factor (family 1)
MDLMNGLRNGDRDAFKQLFDEYYKDMCAHANGFVNDMEKARSVVLDAFRKVWEKRNDFENKDNIKAFLKVVVGNACKDELRRKGRSKEILDSPLVEETPGLEESSLEKELVYKEMMEKIYAEIGKLPSKWRVVMELLYIKGLDPEEVAEVLKINPRSVRYRRKQGLNHLRNKFPKSSGSRFFLLLLLCTLFNECSRN